MGTENIKKIKKVLEELLDIIYPPSTKCIYCGEDGFIGLCSLCKSKIKTSQESEEIISYGFYGGVLKKIILLFKYEKNFLAGKVISDLLIELIKENKIEFDVICYVPMTKDNIRKRGFNQCEIIARRISNNLNIPMSKCLIKIKNTNEQKLLSRDERAKNIIDAFEIKNNKDIKNKVVLLVDDVVTTGATLFECRKILKKNNIKSIKILTIAKSNI